MNKVSRCKLNAAKQSELGKHTGVVLVPISSIQGGPGGVCSSATVELL